MSDLPTAKTRPASNWSAIWVLPLIALIIGGWLGWRAYSQTGIEIPSPLSKRNWISIPVWL